MSTTGMRAAQHRTAGFTLIELLVVISIIGVLAATAIPAYTGRQGKAFDARVVNDARSAATAEEIYFSDTSAYFDGDCALLPAFKLSPGVICPATAAGNVFSIETSHPLATKRCTWQSDGHPNLT